MRKKLNREGAKTRREEKEIFSKRRNTGGLNPPRLAGMRAEIAKKKTINEWMRQNV